MELLRKSVQTQIEKDRIGSPVFLRGILNVVNRESSLLLPTTELVSLANAWIPSIPQKVYATGDVDGTQVTTIIQYTNGQMAVLSVNRVDTETAIDIMLVGNRGVIYHETPIGRHFLSGTPPELGGEGALSEVISRSLANGQPAIVEA
ncbi:hypothetical protein F4083_02400 [Candidatus Poribacteria bacterium]|nr:hypothetical protein [Candidatus Poribacteria bacterium]MYI93161.1 hypothetical protein [Candidatus Poribacteria bacterium]